MSAAGHRGARRSRAAGYAGLLFANLLPLAPMLMAVAPRAWPALALTLRLRGWAGYDVASRTLAQRLNLRSWMLLPLQDVIGFCLWVAGFHGDIILSRGRQYRVLADGRFEPLRP